MAGAPEATVSSNAYLLMADMPERRWRSSSGAGGMGVANGEAFRCCRLRGLAQTLLFFACAFGTVILAFGAFCFASSQLCIRFHYDRRERQSCNRRSMRNPRWQAAGRSSWLQRCRHSASGRSRTAWSEKATAFGGATPLWATFGEILWPGEILTAPVLPKTTSECEAS
jgi:hypothetical protein